MRGLRYRFNRLVFKLSPKLAERLNMDFRFPTPNRVFLEEAVFAYLNALAAESNHAGKTLFVGLDKHNWHYPRLLVSEFHSLDIQPRQAIYGPAGRHWTGSATEMADHYGQHVFDVVVANGLLGYGINDALDFRRLLAQCEHVLKPGGLLVLGYNDKPERVSFPVLPTVREFFDPFVPPISGVNDIEHRIHDPFQHVFIFLKKSNEPVPEHGPMETAAAHH